MPISITCPSCDRGLKAPDTTAGRRIKCPKCGATVSVPDEDEEPRKKAVAAKTSRRDEDDDVEERRPKKKKRKQKSNTGLYVGLGVGAVVLIGVIVLVIVLLTSPKTGSSPNKNEVVEQDKKNKKEKEAEPQQEQEGDDSPPQEGQETQAQRTQSQQRLKNLAQAMYLYHDERKKLPGAAIYGRDDQQKSKPLLSWRVAILPYLEQNNLYKQFNLNEPWDSEQNKKLISPMPEIYKPVRRNPPSGTKTYYQVFTGKKGPFGGKEAPRLASFTDGTSNTFLIVEGDRPAVWTKPDDIEYDFGPKGNLKEEPPGNFKFKNGQPVTKLGGMFDKGFNAVMADGSVHFFLREIPAYKIHAMITHNGGENITLEGP